MVAASEELEASILRQFVLDGEEIIRLGSRKPVKAKAGWRGYSTVRVNLGYRRSTLVSLHRLKFFLRHGWWPEMVDHHDVTPANNRLDNLRAATRGQNAHNAAKRPGKFARGVKRNGNRFWAAICVNGKSRYLGTYDTETEASTVVEDTLRAVYGEFYHP